MCMLLTGAPLQTVQYGMPLLSSDPGAMELDFTKMTENEMDDVFKGSACCF